MQILIHKMLVITKLTLEILHDQKQSLPLWSALLSISAVIQSPKWKLAAYMRSYVDTHQNDIEATIVEQGIYIS